jgi:hypothetical protein
MDELDAIAQTEIQPGWEVLDADDASIGRVVDVHSASFTVETSIGARREIAFTDVESADDGIVRIAVSGEELTSNIGS